VHSGLDLDGLALDELGVPARKVGLVTGIPARNRPGRTHLASELRSRTACP